MAIATRPAQTPSRPARPGRAGTSARAATLPPMPAILEARDLTKSYPLGPHAPSRRCAASR